jgi:hypothetical protein
MLVLASWVYDTKNVALDLDSGIANFDTTQEKGRTKKKKFFQSSNLMPLF